MERLCWVAVLTLSVSACGPLLHRDGAGNSTPPYPTAADCALQGRQLDLNTEQCGVAPPPKAARSSANARMRVATQSSTTEPNAGITIEPDAVIDDTLKDETKLISGLVGLVKRHGYQCNTISAVKPISTSNGFKLACDHLRYKFDIKDEGGRWIITVE
jgi:hypothetical protein